MPIQMDVLMDLPKELSRFVPTFDTVFLNVKGDEEQDFLRRAHPFSWLLSVIREEFATRAEFEEALKAAIEKISPLSNEEWHQWTRAMYYIYLLIHHRRPPEERDALVAIISESIREGSRRKEADEMEQTIAEYLEERGEKRGERRGEKRGELKATREAVLKILQTRFDSVPESIFKQVKSLRSMDRLNTLLRKAIVAQSIDEIELD